MGWVPDLDPPPPTVVQVSAAIPGAVEAAQELMLSDAWDSLPEHRQRAVAEAVEAMRRDVERLRP